MNRSFRVISIIGLVWLLLVPFALSVRVVAQGAVSQEVDANEEIPKGTLVSLSDGDPKKVVLADLSNSEYLFGVVSTTGLSLAEIGKDGEGTQVTTDGDVSVVVSTIYGDIKSGDVIGVSEIQGVAALANNEYKAVTTIGIALEDFNENSDSAKRVASITESGEVREIVIGTIPVRIAVNNFFVDETAKESILISIGESLIGRPVTQMQAVMGSGGCAGEYFGWRCDHLECCTRWLYFHRPKSACGNSGV